MLIPLAMLPVATFTLTRQAQVFVERYLGSGLPPGTISHLNYAAKVSQLAMTAGILIVTVTFPLVARALAAGDLAAARDRVEKDLGQAAAVVLLGTAFLMACAPSVVALLFQRGAFGAHDTAATAEVIRVYSFGLPAQALIGVMVRPFFSLRPVVRRARRPGAAGLRPLDWYPVAAMAVGLLVTAGVGLAATPRYGALGLAVSNAAGITTAAVLLLRGLLLRGIALRLPRVLGGQARLLAAAVGAAAAGAVAAAARPRRCRPPCSAVSPSCSSSPGSARSSAHPRSVTRCAPSSGPRVRSPRLLRGSPMDAEPARGPALPAQPHPARSAPWILMYHSITHEEHDPYLLTVSPERFAAQMAWLARSGRRGVSVRELLRARAAGAAARLVGLTFDDGYADFARYAVPVLRRHGFTASAYVVPDLLGGHNGWDPDGPRKPLLTVDQVVELAAAGWEIGSHGLSHRRLPGLSADELADQARGSRGPWSSWSAAR
ncbi:lipid II flippase MurJ [Kitasatospora arboriphila]